MSSDFRDFCCNPRNLILAQLPVTKIIDHIDSHCPICLLDYISGDEIKTLTCDHFFHSNCIDNWLIKAMTCPSCRALIKTKFFNFSGDQKITYFKVSYRRFTDFLS